MCIPEATWKDLDFYTKYVASYERETVILVNPFILNVFFFLICIAGKSDVFLANQFIL